MLYQVGLDRGAQTLLQMRWCICALYLISCRASADRSAAQGPAGLFLEKAGKYAEAAVYYDRAVRGFEEVWIRFWYGGDSGKAHPVNQQILSEYRDRLKRCLERSRMDESERARLYATNDIWMREYVDEELGGYKLAFSRRAEEAEKHGDFLFARELRLAAADYCRQVAIPYHERAMATARAQRDRDAMSLHRDAAQEHERQATLHGTLAEGARLLASIPGLQHPATPPDTRLLSQHYFKSYALFHKRVLSPKDAGWITGITSERVADVLGTAGMKHPDEAARLLAVTVLAALDRNEAVRHALRDKSRRVRLAAASHLTASPWAEGWAACYRHPDVRVAMSTDALLAPEKGHILGRALTTTELMRGLGSAAPDTVSFCRQALKQITGQEHASRTAWRAWWQGLGNARPGLTRTAPDGTAVLDPQIDFGAWWQSGQRSIRNLPNPLLDYPLPARIEWQGSLVVTEAGTYRFYTRARGEKRSAFDKHGILYFTPACATLRIDDVVAIPSTAAAVEDAKMHMRIDSSEPMPLQPGLHLVRVTLDVRSAGTGPWQAPSIRLYWSSDRFLRQLVPSARLVSVE